jgi:hypothetical protein
VSQQAEDHFERAYEVGYAPDEDDSLPQTDKAATHGCTRPEAEADSLNDSLAENLGARGDSNAITYGGQDESEIEGYFKEPHVSWNADRILRYKLHGGRFPGLAGMALCPSAQAVYHNVHVRDCRASSVTAERLFSQAGK